jgi:putative ABC transport system permease protein
MAKGDFLGEFELLLLRGLRSDLRHAWRRAERTPTVTIAVVLAMTLGIGASTAIMSVMESVFLKPLPFPEPERLVRLGTSVKALGTAAEVNALDARDWADQSRGLRAIGLYDVENVTLHLDGTDAPTSASVLMAGAGLTRVLGVQPLVGRGLVDDDFRHGAMPVVVLGQRFWREAFSADAAVVGRGIGLGAARATIVGVWPEAADRFPTGGTDLWTPLTYPPDSFLNQRGSIALGAVARLNHGVDVAGARAELSTIAKRLAAVYPQTNAGRTPIVDALQDTMVGPVRPMIVLMALSIGAVLAIACANIANLLLAQTCERSREFAVRASLGATQGRLVRQLICESLGLFTIAGLAGISIAPMMTRALISRYPGALPLADDVRVDGRVLMMSIAVTLGAGLIATLPRLRVLGRRGIADGLTEGARGASHRYRRSARLLVVAQVAMSVVLLSGAAGLLRTFLHLSSVSTGFEASTLVTMRISLPATALESPERMLQFQNAARDLAASLPAVERAAHAMFLPFTVGSWHDGYERVGKDDVPPNLPMADFFMVSPEFLSTLGVPIRRGRDLSERDEAVGAPVVVVSETFAARAFPGEQALGRSLRWENRTWEIVGVVADTRHGSLWDAPDPDVYVPRAQVVRANTWLAVRTSRSADAVAKDLRPLLRTLDKSAAVTDVRRLSDRVADSTSPERFRALLTGSLGSLALLLAAVGIYGVVSYTVSRRTRDIGIRMALGQSRASVVRQLLLGIWTTTGSGVAVGLGITWAAGRTIESLFAGMNVHDPGTILSVVAMFFSVATVAALGPACRASRVDPVEALRAE